MPTQAEINANRKKLKKNPLVKTSGGDLIPFEIKQPIQDPQKAKTPEELGTQTDSLLESFAAPAKPKTVIESAVEDVESVGTTSTAADLNMLLNQTPTQRREGIQSEADRLGLDTDIATTPAEMAEKLKAEQAAQNVFAAKQEEQIKQLEDIGLTQASERLRRQTGAAVSAFGGREGVSGTATQALPGLFTRGQEQAMATARDQVTASRTRREELERRRQNALDADRQDLAQDIAREIESEEIKEKTALLNAEASFAESEALLEKAQTESQKAAQTQIDFLADMPAESLALIPSEQINTTFVDAGYSYGTGAAFKDGVMQLNEAQQIKDEEERAIAIDTANANLDKIRRSNQTEAQKAVEGYQTLKNALDLGEANGGITQEAFDSLSQSMNLAKPEVNPLDDKIKQAQLNLANSKNEAERIANQKALYDLQDQYDLEGNGIETINIVGKIPTDPNASAEEVYKSAGITRTGEDKYLGECSAFVNDVNKTPSKYGSDYSDKTKHINNWTIDNPSAGSIFISSVGNSEIGHVGIVESVNYSERTAVLTDMNRNGKQKFSRRTVAFDDLAKNEGIVGYENVANTKKSEKPMEGVFTKLVNENIESGMNEEEARKLAFNQVAEEQKDMTETEAKSFAGYASAIEENKIYNEVIEEVDMDGYTNSVNAITTEITDPDTKMTGELINKYFVTPEARRAVHAELRWLLPVLRKESGAAVSVGEYKTKGTGFFARSGDDPLTLKDKERARTREAEVLYATMGAKGQKLIKDSNVTDLKKVTDSGELKKLKDQTQVWMNLKDGNGDFLYTKQDIIDTYVSEGIDPYFINQD